MTLSSDWKIAAVSLRIGAGAFRQARQLLRDRVPALLEAHLAMLLHRLGGPVARSSAIPGSVAVGLDLEGADHERFVRLPPRREGIGEDEPPLGLELEQDAADALFALAISLAVRP